jgi:hypothetical protein
LPPSSPATTCQAAYWQEQVEIMRVAAEGWVAFARRATLAGDQDAARRHYTALLEIAASAELPNASLAAAREHLAGR